MKNLWSNFKCWCNANPGLLGFFTLLISAVAVVPFNKIDLNLANTFFGKAILIFVYQVKMPLYLFLVLVAIGIFYVLRLKKRYATKSVSLKFLSGLWVNEWNLNGIKGFETLRIDDEGSYFLNGAHIFNIEGFQYNPAERKIIFVKVAVQPGDTRRLTNSLIMSNNDLLTGTENGYSIKYSRVPG